MSLQIMGSIPFGRCLWNTKWVIKGGMVVCTEFGFANSQGKGSQAHNVAQRDVQSERMFKKKTLLQVLCDDLRLPHVLDT